MNEVLISLCTGEAIFEHFYNYYFLLNLRLILPSLLMRLLKLLLPILLRFQLITLLASILIFLIIITSFFLRTLKLMKSRWIYSINRRTLFIKDMKTSLINIAIKCLTKELLKLFLFLNVLRKLEIFSMRTLLVL